MCSRFSTPRVGQWMTVVALAVFAGCSSAQMEKDLEQARAKTRSWADRLDSQTTDTGTFIRHQGDQLPDKDPWGTALRVRYSRGGVSEVVTVSSAGPDRQFDTDDDVIEERWSTNLAGVGEGVKKNVGEVAENAAAGMVKGTMKGVKEGIRDSLAEFPGRKDNDKPDDAAPVAGDESSAAE